MLCGTIGLEALLPLGSLDTIPSPESIPYLVGSRRFRRHSSARPILKTLYLAEKNAMCSRSLRFRTFHPRSQDVVGRNRTAPAYSLLLTPLGSDYWKTGYPDSYSGHGRIHPMAHRNAHMRLRSQIQSYRDESPHGLRDL